MSSHLLLLLDRTLVHSISFMSVMLRYGHHLCVSVCVFFFVWSSTGLFVKVSFTWSIHTNRKPPTLSSPVSEKSNNNIFKRIKIVLQTCNKVSL